MRRFPLFRWLALALLPTLPVLASCGDSTGPPPVGAIVPQGASISGEAGSFVTVQVRIDDEQNNPIEGIEVSFTPGGQSGSVNPALVNTGADGLAQASWTLGTTAGDQSLNVTAGDQSLTLSATVSAGPPDAIEIVSGDGQTGTVGQALASSVTVEVVDRFDNPAAGTTVTFSTSVAGAGASPATTTAESDGRASTTWTLGESAGPQTLQARAGAAGSVTFTATAEPGAPAQVVIVSGNAQEAQVGETLSQPLVAAVQDEFGNELEGLTLQFIPAEGNGSVTPGSAQTDANGQAQTVWTLGGTAGTQTVAAQHADLEPAEFTAEAAVGDPVALVKVSGDNQEGAQGTTLAEPLVVKVEDEFGNGVPGISVGFNPINGLVSPGVDQTDSEGLRSATWTLGDELGEQMMEAEAEGLGTVTFTATATEFNGVLEVVRGDNQTSAVGTRVPIPPRVRLTDGSGNPVGGVDLTFSVASGGGSVLGGVQTTDGNGIATVDEWTLGGAPGENTLAVAGEGVTAATISATGEGTGGGFDIEVRFVGEPPTEQEQAFLDAEAKWERIIVGDIPDIDINIEAGDCSIAHPAVDETVDDLVIFAALDSIDGSGGVIGAAGPCYYRTPSRLTIIGVMRFDIADLADFNDAGLLDEVVVHEMGHALGFVPTAFSDLGLIADRGTPDTRFLGEGAIARFERAGGTPQGAVPLEGDEGGGGTLDAHWDEALFDNELMTGFIQSGVNPLSAISVAAFWDIGYMVDVTEAEAYTISEGALRAYSGIQRIHLRELPLPEARPIGPDGRPINR